MTGKWMKVFVYCWLLLMLAPAQPLFSSDNSTAVVDDPEAERQPAPKTKNEELILKYAIKPRIPPAQSKPPLPFAEPQVGPLIKRFYPSEVDRRTTAFIPTTLSSLTPITTPKTSERWIRVDLSEQIVVAYEAGVPVRAFVISSGLPGTETVTGEFRIRAKVRSQVMSGGYGSLYYFLPNVQWVQYFFEDYGFHGTYWHNDFGRPHSHGCINMTNADAKWLFDWASPAWDGSKWQKANKSEEGTLVIVHE